MSENKSYLTVDKDGTERIWSSDNYPNRDYVDITLPVSEWGIEKRKLEDLNLSEKELEEAENDLDYQCILLGNIWTGFEEPCFLPKGSIEKLIGKELTWDSEPYELRKS